MKINPCPDCGHIPEIINDRTLKICHCADKLEDLIRFWNSHEKFDEKSTWQLQKE